MMADKFLFNNAGVITEKEGTVVSLGANSAGNLPALGADGRLDQTMMPTGIGADVATISASEALGANELVNIWSDGGVAKVRKADATTAGKEAHGFVKEAFSVNAAATIFFEGSASGLSGLTPGKQYLSTNPGQPTNVAPSGSGNIVQVVGFATSSTTLNFQSSTTIVLA